MVTKLEGGTPYVENYTTNLFRCKIIFINFIHKFRGGGSYDI